MAKRKPHFGQTDATKLQDALHGLTDAGLVFLKAFASVEHLVNCLLATRLASKPEMLPMLSFIAAARLALALIGLTEEAFETLLRRAAHIRNQIAHEIDTPKPGEFASFIGEVREWSQKNRHDCA